MVVVVVVGRGNAVRQSLAVGEGASDRTARWSPLQLELEALVAPLAGVAVEHGAFHEGHGPCSVYQDHCVGPGREREKQRGTENNINC